MKSPARAFADRYVDLVNRGEYGELRQLFADDALFLAPGNQCFVGPEAIGAFYERFLAELLPQVRIATYVEQGDDCVYELEAIVKGDTEYRLGAIDHATLDADGKVRRFAVYTK